MVADECERLQIERGESTSRGARCGSTRNGATLTRVHLHRLEEIEYLIVHRGGRGQGNVVYRLRDRRARQPGSSRPWVGL